jgi:MoxR-like ATPase
MPEPVDPNRSCLNCPSLLNADNSTFFNKSVGVPICARFGKPLGKINSSRAEKEAIGRQFASKCSEFGKPKPLIPNWEDARFSVMLPDPSTIGVTRSAPEMVTSCAGCKFFIREDVVASELGWTAGLCSAKGNLVLANRYTLEARKCDLRDFGMVRTETSGLTYLPEYEDDFRGSVDPVRAMRENLANFVDPTEYPTDKPVDPADADRIRAWRKVTDPLTGNSVFLPIYRRDFFSESNQKLIPATGSEEHPEDYLDHNFYTYKVAVLWMELDETPAFWGGAGTGKTEFYRHMAWLMQLPFHRFSITGSSELDDLAGKMSYTEGVGTHFDLGRFSKAWTSPCVCVVDEYNAGPPEVQQYLRPAIDNSKQLVLDQAPDAPILERDLDFFLGVAMNPAWDMLNVGTNPIAAPDADRLMHLFIELPPEEIEKEIIRKRCEHDGWDIPDSKLKTVMKIAKEIRALTTQENAVLPISWAIRPQLKVSRALRWFDWLTAYRMAAADYLEPQQQAMVLDVVKSHLEGGA